MVVRWEVLGLLSLVASVMIGLTAYPAPVAAADVDELLRLERWLHGPPVPAEPLYAHA